MGFSKQPDKDFPNSSFKDIVDKHAKDPGRYSKEDYAKAESNLEKIKERNADDIRESGKELDKHLIWASGGALVLASNIFLSERLISLHYMGFLMVAFVAFGISVIAIVCSYKTSLRSLMGIPKARLASDAISEHIRDIKEGMSDEEQAKVRGAIDTAYDEFKNQVIRGQAVEKWTGYFNSAAFWFFVLGMVSFLTFGGLNLFFFQQAPMTSDKQTSTGGAQPPAKVEKAAQVAGQALSDMANNLNVMISASGASPNSSPSSQSGSHAASAKSSK